MSPRLSWIQASPGVPAGGGAHPAQPPGRERPGDLMSEQRLLAILGVRPTSAAAGNSALVHLEMYLFHPVFEVGVAGHTVKVHSRFL